MIAKGLLTWTQEANLQRGRSFLARRDEWRRNGIRYHAAHSDAEQFAPALLARMFDSGLRIVGPAREYAYRVDEFGQTVRINVENWRWTVLDGTAEGRGLYELWAWRFGVTVAWAHASIFVLSNAANEKPARRKAAAA